MLTEVSPKRIHLITAKDVDNIDRMIGINTEYRRHNDDSTSIGLWVEEMRSRENDNPVLFYKPLEKDNPDFMLIIQSTFQASMLKQFSSQRAVFVDDTHGTNAYGIHLTTLLVVDEYGEGFPVAWCISTHIDTNSISKFFDVIKNNVGNISPKWFMSDDADQFYNAWIKCFQGSPNRILCIWHVLRAWKNNLRTLKDHDKEEEIYHELKVMMDETDQNKFEIMIENAVTKWKTDISAKGFAEYFERHYKFRCTQWARCYRTTSGVNTNMYLEAFHHVLKYNFLKGKRNQRVDRLVHGLMEYLRHKTFDRIIKLEKGKITGRLAQIQNRHDASRKLPDELVSEVDSSMWKVKSEIMDNEYTIEEVTKTCPENCQLKCNECGICVHLFSCTCPDSLLQHTICKHVHLVARRRSKLSSKAPDYSNHCSIYAHNDLNKTLLKEVTPQCLPNIDSLKHRIFAQLQYITSLVASSSSTDALQSAEKTLTLVKNTLTIMDTEHTELIPTSISGSTKKIETQRSFSLKKKNQRCKVKFGNPSSDQRRKIKDTLLGIETNSIGTKVAMCIWCHCISIYICRSSVKRFVYNAK